MTRLLRVTTNDDVVFTGQDAREIVRQMKLTQWSAPEAKRDYIRQVVKRVWSMTGVPPAAPVRPPGTATKLLRYLVQVGLVRVERYDDEIC